MAQKLAALTAFLEDPVLCPAPTAGGSQPQEPLFSQDSVGLFVHMVLINSHKTHIYINKVE